jgi:RNA polymerase sigma factor for flagellar operon FliA
MNEMHLAAHTAPEPEEAQRERLILQCLPEVQWLARSLVTHLPSNCAYEDLVSAGVLGLIAAVDKYDQRFNVQLKTYVQHRIRGAMLDSLRSAAEEPFRHRKSRRRIAAATAALEQRLQRAPEEEEVAAEIGLPLAALQRLKLRVRPLRFCSVDAAPGGEEGRTVLDSLSDSRQREPQAELEQAEMERSIKAHLRLLPCREREVLVLHFVQGLSLTNISRMMGRHASRISQLKDQGIHRLRRQMNSADSASGGAQRASMR